LEKPALESSMELNMDRVDKETGIHVFSHSFSQVFTYFFPHALLSIINFISDEPKKHPSLL
jgi:hypothetical protein